MLPGNSACSRLASPGHGAKWHGQIVTEYDRMKETEGATTAALNTERIWKVFRFWAVFVDARLWPYMQWMRHSMAFPHSLNLQVGTMYGASAFWKNQRLEAKRYCINQRYGKTKSDTSLIKVIKRQKEATDRILHVHKDNGANLISCSASAVETQHNKS